VLRGGIFDVFGYTQERRLKRSLIAQFEARLDELVADAYPAKGGEGSTLKWPRHGKAERSAQEFEERLRIGDANHRVVNASIGPIRHL
jgi:hypothetical protein